MMTITGNRNRSFVGILVIVGIVAIVSQWHKSAVRELTRNTSSENLRLLGHVWTSNSTNFRKDFNTPSTSCSQRQNVMFLKMHKCASSTVQNILFRYGEKRDLNFVIPVDRWQIRGPPYTNYIHIPTKVYNIWCQHSSFQEKGFIKDGCLKGGRKLVNADETLTMADLMLSCGDTDLRLTKCKVHADHCRCRTQCIDIFCRADGTQFYGTNIVYSSDVFTLHESSPEMKTSVAGIAEIMPHDTVYVTILRDPVTMFESIFTYIKLDTKFKISGPNPFVKFVNNPNKYYNKSNLKWAKNPMLGDLGLEIREKNNQQRIDALIEWLGRKFHLVMLAEYFNESLILFKHLMCWSIEDIAYFTLNARSKSSVFTAITPEMKKKIEQWNLGDVKLYRYFNRTFWKKVTEFGEDKMRKEVEKLVTVIEYFNNRCVDNVVQNKEGVWRPGGINVESLQLKAEAKYDEECVAMASSEPESTERIRVKLKERYHIE